MHANDPAHYDFVDYLNALGSDWWQPDELLQRWVARSSLDERTLRWLAELGTQVAGPWRTRADQVERRENLPRIVERGPYNQPCEELWLPAATRRALGELHGSGIWRAALDERARYAAVYLINQNGEAGITCSMACTDGLARMLRRFPDDERNAEVIAALENATPEHWIHGAQFVTEIQGGSDAATNAVRAEPLADDLWSLRGQKWFCSNVTADYWLVTARTPGAAQDHTGVSLFCVPRLRDGRANGHRLLRLKDKLGTRALPTAELELEDARGWMIGPADAGLRNMVSTVLTTSRVHNVVAAAAFIRRATREALAYAQFRRAFGRRLDEHPLIEASLAALREAADRSAAGAFATVDAWTAALAHPQDAERGAWARVLVSLAKATGTRQAPGQIYAAMMVLGGNGIEERFCALPRLWRDSAILETWEGPYTLLLMNALEDLVRLGVRGDERRFLEHGFGESVDDSLVEELEHVLARADSSPGILAWARLAPRLYAEVESRALASLQRR